MITAQMVIDEARGWLGTPFRHQASIKGVGCDCAGLVRGVGRALGLTDCNFSRYSREPGGPLVTQVCQEHLDPVGTWVPGCILQMAFAQEPQHLAIFTGDTVIHSYENAGRCVEHTMNRQWAAMVRAAWSFRGLS